MKTKSIQSQKYTLLATALATILSMNTQAAERVNMADNQGSNKRIVNTNLYEKTGLSNFELRRTSAYAGKNKQTRYQQYYQGIPVLGHAVIVNGESNSFLSTAITGSILKNIAMDLPSVTPLQSSDAITQVAEGQIFGASLSSTPYLYIMVDASEKANLVYLVDVRFETAGKAQQTSFLIDANSAAVIEKWDSLDAGDGMGPGGILVPVATSLKSAGWTKDQVQNLLYHTNYMHWTAHANARDASCGGIAAARELGYDDVAVRVAFSNVEICRTTHRDGKLNLTVPKITEVVLPSEGAAKSTTTLTETAESAKDLDLTAIKRYAAFNTGREWWNRMEVFAGVNANDFNNGALYANKIIASTQDSGNADGQLSSGSTNHCKSNGDNCVKYSRTATGSRTTENGKLVLVQDVPGEEFENNRTSNSAGSIRFPAVDNWYAAETVSTGSWSNTTTTGMAASLTLNFENLFGGSVSVDQSQSSTYTKQFASGQTRTVQRRELNVRPGCRVIARLYFGYTPVTDTWTTKTKFTGKITGSGYIPGYGDRYVSREAGNFFSPSGDAVVAITKIPYRQAPYYSVRFEYEKIRSTAVNCSLY
jgi:Fungalysin/Thermolysin Propeptide Motif